MAQSIKPLVHKCEDPSSNPQHPRQNYVQQSAPAVAVLGGEDRRIPEVHWSAGLAK